VGSKLIGFKLMYWTHLAQDKYHHRALENMTMVFGTPQKEMGLRPLQQGMRQWTGLVWLRTRTSEHVSEARGAIKGGLSNY
jgi:hypothetical protein